MPPEDDSRSSAFSTKEMLVRLDGKLDAVLTRQQNYEVELALVKARADGLELADHNRSRDAEKWRDETRREQESWRLTIGKEVGQLRRHQEKLGRKHAYQTGAMAALVLIANLAVPITLHLTH